MSRRARGRGAPPAASPLRRCRHAGTALLTLLAAAWLAGCARPPTDLATAQAGPGAGADPTAAPTPSANAQPPSQEVAPTPRLAGLARERREVRFAADDGVRLAGELALPTTEGTPPLAVIIHHSGPVARDAYGYLAELLLRRGYAVFRFDKRGTGASGGSYGCCEADDALAAYRAAVGQAGIDRCRVFIVAQSIGTRQVAERFAEYVAATPPVGVALLSNLLGPDEITAVVAPVHIIIAAAEPERERIGPEAVAAHQRALSLGAGLYIAEGAEHTLFDISERPIDWSDPGWVDRYHRGAMESLLGWLDAQGAPSPRCASASTPQPGQMARL